MLLHVIAAPLPTGGIFVPIPSSVQVCASVCISVNAGDGSATSAGELSSDANWRADVPGQVRRREGPGASGTAVPARQEERGVGR